MQQTLIQTWDDLSPKGDAQAAIDPFAQLTTDQLDALGILVRIRWLISSDRAKPDGESAQEAQQIEQTFRADGIDVNHLLAQREAVRQHRMEQTKNANVDEQLVKLPGRMLHLANDPEGRITQFLLMPQLPQCSHLPPPPANQVVYVCTPVPVELKALSRQRGTNKAGPLWVSVQGKLQFRVTEHQVYRTDGFTLIGSSYVMQPTAISTCTPKEMQQMFAWKIREERALLHPKLTDVISISN